jgi:hypothetical protein
MDFRYLRYLFQRGHLSIIVIVISVFDLEKRLKFVQNNEEFAQKLTTSIWWDN